MKLNEKAFTLIELLAVVVILGLLMSAGVVAVSKYIDDSRRKTYIDTALEYITIASEDIAQGKFVIRDSNIVYYIHIDNLQTEKGKTGSPWGKWVDAYVVVTIDDDNNYNYYWISVDESGHRVDLTEENELDKSDIYISSNKTIDADYPLGGRDNVVVYDSDGDKKSTESAVRLTKEEADECYTYTESNGKITITDYNASCGLSVQVPSSIDGKTVVAIAEGAFKSKGLTNVYIFKGVTKIGYGAFQGNSLTYVKLSSTVATVSDYAFYQNSISTLVMSEGINTIGDYAFASNKICSVSFPQSLTSIGSHAFYDNCLTSVSVPSNTTISSAAFSKNNVACNNAFIYKTKTDGTIDYTTIIGYAGEENCRVDLVIPSSKNGVALTTISSNAFENADLSGTLTIPDTVTTISSSAFAYNSLTSINWSSNLKTIGSYAFRSNYLTNDVIETIPSTVTSIGKVAFNRNSATGDSAFVYARTSSGIDYTTIVSYAGGRETASRSVTIPATMNGVTLKSIDSYAFQDCYLTSITFPSLTETPSLTIADNAFRLNNVSGSDGFIYKLTNGVWDYSTLSSYAGPSKGESGTITIPETANGVTLKTINATFTWMSYSKVIIPSGVTTIKSSTFAKSGRNNQNLTTIVNKTGRSFDWTSLTSSSTSDQAFVTGTIIHEAGNITVSDS